MAWQTQILPMINEGVIFIKENIRKSQIEMYKEKRRRAFLSTSSTRINTYNRYSYMEYENQVCTAAECYQPVPWKRGRRVYSFMQRWCTNWGRIDHNSFSICFWPKQWHFFLQVVASPFQLRSVSFSRGVGLSLSFVFFSCLKLQMVSLCAWFW